MQTGLRMVLTGMAVGLGAVAFTGCAAFREKVTETDVNNMPAFDAQYGAQDLQRLSESLATEIAASPRLTKDAVAVFYDLANKTTIFVDTQAITDRIRNLLMQKSQLRFVNREARDKLLKEQGYQAEHATSDSRVSIGKQTGARYMITGAFTEISKQTGKQVRVSRTEMFYYQLTLEVTDLESGIIVLSSMREFARQKREPIVGW